MYSFKQSEVKTSQLEPTKLQTFKENLSYNEEIEGLGYQNCLQVFLIFGIEIK